MRSFALVGAVFLLIVATTSNGRAGEFFSGAKLLEICTAGQQGSDPGSMFCTGYISGIQDVLSDPIKHEVCTPDDVVLAEMLAAVVGFLRDNPELLDFGAAGLVKKALVLKYPCAKKL